MGAQAGRPGLLLPAVRWPAAKFIIMNKNIEKIKIKINPL